jgi:hypothetical protein
VVNYNDCPRLIKPLKKRCRILLPGVWGCPPALKIPQDWGNRGLIETISAVSFNRYNLIYSVLWETSLD